MSMLLESPLTTSVRSSYSEWVPSGEGLTVTRSGNVIGAGPNLRPRRALLEYARDGLVALAKHRGADDMRAYSEALTLISALVEDGGPTPQVSDNGDGGIASEWLVNGATLTLDIEDVDSVYLIARDFTGDIRLEAEGPARGFGLSLAAAQARLFLRELAAGMRQPISLPR